MDFLASWLLGQLTFWKLTISPSVGDFMKFDFCISLLFREMQKSTNLHDINEATNDSWTLIRNPFEVAVVKIVAYNLI